MLACKCGEGNGYDLSVGLVSLPYSFGGGVDWV